MKLLISGASGQLGKEWIHFCLQNGIHFQSYDSKSLDITNESAIFEACEECKPDVFINCAAYTKVDQAELEVDSAMLVNAEAVETISKICKQLHIKLVHYSTDYVFAGTKNDQEMLEDGYPEEFEADPINVYGLSKRKGEIAIQNSGCSYLILRVSWLCGQFGNNFVKTMIRLGSERDELSVVNDQFGCPTFTDQVVEQSAKLLDNQKEGIYHLGSDGIISWFDFAKRIFDLQGIKLSINPVDSSQFPTKAKRPAFSKLSTQKISTIPEITILSWENGLQKLINSINE